MIKSIKLTNFRKHVDKYVEFKSGLNVIRGANEIGKSTLYEAILYACFGSSALKESLSGVVTYGVKESKLAVELLISVGCVDYTITRSPSGAEIRYEDELVSGQTVTKNFMEEKFGCSMQVAQQLMFARQSDIKGVLNNNSTASTLVEGLANLGQIEQIIEAIQGKYPTGATTNLDGQIEATKLALEQPPEPPSQANVEAASKDVSKAQEGLKTATAAYEVILNKQYDDRIVQDAEKAVELAKKAQYALAAYEQQVTSLSVTANAKKATIDVDKLEDLRKQAASAELAQMRLNSYSTKFPVYEGPTWEGSYDELVEAIDNKQAAIKKLTPTVAAQDKQIALDIAAKITESVCSFCKKDLSAVVEVTALNSKLDDSILRRKKDLATTVDAIEALNIELDNLLKIKTVTDKVYKLAKDGWEMGKILPPKPTWVGEVPEAVEDVAVVLQKLEADYKHAITRNAQIDDAIERLNSLVKPTIPNISAEVEVLDTHKQLQESLSNALLEVNLKKHLLKQSKEYQQQVESDYESQVKSFEKLQASYNKLKDTLVQLQTQRADTIKYNLLIKELRHIRPQIAAKMWQSVQAAISHYFSIIRQETSLVERDTKQFLVNGRSTTGLSGSAEDMLGLSIRMALTKVFIPWFPVILLDESFSACDESREMAGVGALVAADFPQTLLVTHSNAPESMADNLVVL